MKAYIWFITYARELDALSHFNAFTGDKLPSKLAIYLVIDFTVLSNSHQSPYWNNLWNLALTNLTWSWKFNTRYNTTFQTILLLKNLTLWFSPSLTSWWFAILVSTFTQAFANFCLLHFSLISRLELEWNLNYSKDSWSFQCLWCFPYEFLSF